MNRRIKYPIGVQSFSEIIERGYAYVDKTEYVYELVDTGKYYFLSRPRRFGKSLFLSTLEAFFLGRRELFNGLALSRHEDLDWATHPVFHLDFNAKDYTKDDSALFNLLDNQLSIWEEEYCIIPKIKDPDTRFYNLIIEAYKKTGKQAVVLIDEYDRPLLQNIRPDRLGRQERFRETLRGFFGVLKSCDQYIRFAFLTGITKFGKVSVFSDLNNLEDITLEPKFNSVCGISEKELYSDFKEGIEELAANQEMGISETREKLKKNYDGYRFSEKRGEDVYNPFSILNVLKSSRFADYWFMTGTPTMLIELLRDSNTDLSGIDGAMRTESELMGLDPVFSDPVPLLFQSGYLTIKGVENEDEPIYRLGFPNEEVERGFLKALLPYYINVNRDNNGFRISRFTSALRDGNVDLFMNLLKALMAGIPYSESKNKIYEDRFRDVIFIICRLMGMSVHCELHTGLGRIDMTVETEKYVYVIEFKVDKSPKEALAQIENKHYTDRYLTDPRTLFKVGVEFSTSERNISAWEAVGSPANDIIG